LGTNFPSPHVSGFNVVPGRTAVTFKDQNIKTSKHQKHWRATKPVVRARLYITKTAPLGAIRTPVHCAFTFFQAFSPCLMPRPISATIHTAALAHNLAVIRQRAPHSKRWAVVKANAYGHGLAHAFSGLRAADGFGLLNLDEAVKLRDLGWAGPILLLEGFFHATDLDLIDRYSLTTVIHCDEQMRMLEVARLSRPVNIHLKMNSGMNRLGYTPERFHAAWERARACANIGQITLMTHFCDADNARGVAHQMEAFERGAQGIAGERSLASSAAILWHPATQFDWVRPGIALYGASPSGIFADIAEVGLQPAMTLEAGVIATQSLQKGQTVGYGSTFTAPAPMRIGVVACGYADGYPRTAPEGTPVRVGGVLTRIVGRVSMDMLTVDLTPCPQANVGTRAELWGATLPVDDVAQACGTVGYELMCALAPRVTVRAQ
jgi:alanine racemase